MAIRAATKLFIPNDMKEKMARENAKLLMQAQSDFGTLSGQMAAGTEGTKKLVEQMEGQGTTTQPAQSSGQAGWHQQGQGSAYPAQASGQAGWYQQGQSPAYPAQASGQGGWSQGSTAQPAQNSPTQAGWYQGATAQPAQANGQGGWPQQGQNPPAYTAEANNQSGWYQQGQGGNTQAQHSDNGTECIIQ
jgi:hypothetical protein